MRGIAVSVSSSRRDYTLKWGQVCRAWQDSLDGSALLKQWEQKLDAGRDILEFALPLGQT